MTAALSTVTFDVRAGVLGVDGARVACPHCGERDRFTIRVVPDDAGEAPVYVRCWRDHLWAESALPRRVFAELLARVAAEDPAAWAELNRVLAERGSFTVGM
ncbi:hypothetical protein ACLQ2R_19625 [Streptosporangium sp. DT93]|uniref:hypothetical protein n=1 Tax=Streptosporangium sp. DT93 TaxID=3393428 RepID=UPI003CEF0334